MMAERLTAEQAAVLDKGTHRTAIKLDNFSDESLAFMRTLSEMGMVKQILEGCYYTITDTGKRALATYKAQRDLVLFIAEFEEWLELEVKLQNEYEGVYEDDTFQGVGRAEQAENTLEKYRQCKQRIEPHHDE